MRTKIVVTGFVLASMASPAMAQENTRHPADHQHGSEIWHAFTLESYYGGGKSGGVGRGDGPGDAVGAE